MGAVGALLLDMVLSLLLLLLLMVYYRWALTWLVLWLPVFVLAAILAASGLGLILSALNVNFRDVKYAVPFLIQMGIFVTPVIYPPSYLPSKWRLVLAMNPMTGVVMGFRHALLGSPISWSVAGISLGMSLLLFVGGLFIFRRLEARFADVI